MANFTDEQIQKVWEKGQPVTNNDPNIYRKDDCGAWIRRDMYGKTGVSLSFGWTIDHIKPESKGGSSDMFNLRPLQWENNLSKSDGKLGCTVTSEGITNKYL